MATDVLYYSRSSILLSIPRNRNIEYGRPESHLSVSSMCTPQESNPACVTGGTLAAAAGRRCVAGSVRVVVTLRPKQWQPVVE